MRLLFIILHASFVSFLTATTCKNSFGKKSNLSSECLKLNRNTPLCYHGTCEICHAGEFKCYPGKSFKKCCKICPMAVNCPGEKDLSNLSTFGATCGLPEIAPNVYPELETSKTHTFIVGGEDAKAHSWPWQVSFRRNRYTHFCGGSILNSFYALTAAHCRVDKIMHQIVVGDHRSGIDGRNQHWTHLHKNAEQGTFYSIENVYTRSCTQK